MGILSETAIRAALHDGTLIITPAPAADHFDSDSVEVHLGNQIYTWKPPGGKASITVPLWKQSAGEAFSYKEFARSNLVPVPLDPDGILTMRPHTFYLADLLQRTELPPDLAMHIQGKSTLARLGVLVHLTAPHAHAGWKGTLTLEIYNLGPFNVELKPGAPIGQLTFWRVEQPVKPEEIKPKTFSGQRTANGTA